MFIFCFSVRRTLGGRGDCLQVQEWYFGDQQQPRPEDCQVQVQGQRPLQLPIWRRGRIEEEDGKSIIISSSSGVACLHKEADKAGNHASHSIDDQQIWQKHWIQVGQNLNQKVLRPHCRNALYGGSSLEEGGTSEMTKRFLAVTLPSLLTMMALIVLLCCCTRPDSIICRICEVLVSKLDSDLMIVCRWGWVKSQGEGLLKEEAPGQQTNPKQPINVSPLQPLWFNVIPKECKISRTKCQPVRQEPGTTFGRRGFSELWKRPDT